MQVVAWSKIDQHQLVPAAPTRTTDVTVLLEYNVPKTSFMSNHIYNDTDYRYDKKLGYSISMKHL